MQDAEQATQTITQQSEGVHGSQAPAPPPTMLATMLMIGGIMLAIFLLLRKLYRKPKVSPHITGVSSREKLAEARERATAKREGFERYMAEAEELTRRLAATLDNKAARLEHLLDDAEARIRDLEAVQGGMPAHSATAKKGTSREGGKLGGRSRLDPSLLDQARLDQLTRERSGAGVKDSDSSEELQLRVYELADAGNSAVEIARKLDEPVGQIELMLNLRRQTG